MKGKMRLSCRVSITGLAKIWIPSCCLVNGTSSAQLLELRLLFLTSEKCSTTQDYKTFSGSLPSTQSFIRLAE